MTPDDPIAIATDVWWVGARLANDRFQCHAYFIDNGANSVLIDPGSPLTIATTMEKVARIADVDSIRYVVCHHSDPDIAAGLPWLSDRLTRPDVEVVTEWRAEALLKHYGHRFGYYRVEEHYWTVPLGAGRDLEFQLTPYLHFPGAMVSWDSGSATLFSSDLFGGFVPDLDILISDDLDYIIEAARPFHQHYMPSTELLTAGLTRIQQRWPHISLIAPQHGHVIPAEQVDAAFAALKGIACGVFTLADADIDLKRLLRLSEAKTRITEALLTFVAPGSLVTAMNTILSATHEAHDCALFIDVPGKGWTMWQEGLSRPLHREPDPRWPTVDLLGPPAALLTLHTVGDVEPDEDLMEMLADMAPTVRPAIDEYLEHLAETQRTAGYRAASLTDPLTGLGNRRALDDQLPIGDYALISLDLDHFKAVNDEFGHAAGDTVLQRVSEVLKACVRDRDAVFRLGGEEFLIILPDTGEDASVTIGERIRLAVKAAEFDGLAPGGHISVSQGVTCVRDAVREDFASALAVADHALYQSKESGRDMITVHHAHHDGHGS